MTNFFNDEISSSIINTKWSGHMSQMGLKIQPSFFESIKEEFLIDMIHRFWTLKGLLDFKILGNKGSSEFFLIWSFQKEEDYERMLNSEVWSLFMTQLQELIEAGKTEVVYSIANTYEIIE